MNDRHSPRVLESLTIVRDLAVLSCFGLWLLIPGVAQMSGFSSVDDIATIEFRQPAQAPSMPENLEAWRTLPSSIEDYLNDHFGFRFQMGLIHSTLLTAIGTSSSDEVLLGNEGWLFLSSGNMVDVFRGTLPLSKEKIDSWAENVTTVHEALERQGIDHVVTLIPNKWSVYPEHLPKWARPQAKTQYSVLADSMTRSGVPFVDARSVIMPEKVEGEERLFRKTDTHCTTRASYITYQQIMNVLARRQPRLTPILPSDLSVETVEILEPGDLHRFLHSTPILEEPPLAAYRVDSSHRKVLAARVVSGNKWSEISYGEALAKVWGLAYSSDAANTMTVLVYADSFTIPMQAFLVNSFSEVVMVRHRKGVLDSDYIRAVKPQIVLLNLNEKALRNPPRLVSLSPDLEEIRW